MRLTSKNGWRSPMDSDTINAMYKKLAAYEDTGLEPEAVDNLRLSLCGAVAAEIAEEQGYVEVNRAKEIAHAEAEGRLVILPCKVGDTVWFYLYEDRCGIRRGIYQGIITELKAVQRLNRDAPLFLACVCFEYPDPWYSFKQLSTSEMHCSFGEYGSWVRFYLTREEAEAALKGGQDNA